MAQRRVRALLAQPDRHPAVLDEHRTSPARNTGPASAGSGCSSPFLRPQRTDRGATAACALFTRPPEGRLSLMACWVDGVARRAPALPSVGCVATSLLLTAGTAHATPKSARPHTPAAPIEASDDRSPSTSRWYG